MVELPPWGVVVSQVSLHPDASSQQPLQVLGALDQQGLLILFWQGRSDSTWDDDNLGEWREVLNSTFVMEVAFSHITFSKRKVIQNICLFLLLI